MNGFITTLLIASLAPVPFLPIVPSRYACPMPAVEKPIRIRASKDCRYFLGDREVTWDEFAAARRTVTHFHIDEKTGEAVRIVAEPEHP